MLADYHVHSYFSEDTDCPMENEIRKAIEIGLDELCFTEHVDYGIPTVDQCDYDSYFEEFFRMKEKYKNQIKLKAGIEFGVQVHTVPEYEEAFKKYPFDFVLLSFHQVDDKEFWRQDFQKGKTQEEYNRKYYEEILEVAKIYKNYSVIAHMDVIKRYDLQGEYPFEKIKDQIRQIFEVIIPDGKGIEINTSSRAYKLKSLMPSREILELYHEMGGEVITIGSDSHNEERIGEDVQEMQNLLREIGFKGIYTFNQMQPVFHPFETE